MRIIETGYSCIAMYNNNFQYNTQLYCKSNESLLQNSITYIVVCRSEYIVVKVIIMVQSDILI